MKERITGILSGLLMIGCGVVCFVMADEYVMMLFGVLKVDLRIVGAVVGVLGLAGLVGALLPKKGQKQQAAPVCAQGDTAEEEAYLPQTAVEVPQMDVRALVLEAREDGSAEAFRRAIVKMEPIQEADPDNMEVVAGMLACYDGYLRTKGDRTFADYQQRFYAALRAVYLEEQNGRKATSRRFWAIHSAVHGGIAAASSKDLESLEDAAYMLERAAEMKSEGNREVDTQYTQTAIPSVRCWVSYWIARITATDQPDYERSIEALQLAATLFPREGDIRVCDMNPHLKDNTKTMLTWNNLDALRRHLIKVASE